MLSLALLLVAIPAVTLSEGHQAQTRVAVGDAFPKVAGLADARGEKATVVAATGGPEWMSKMLAGDLKDDFAKKYATKGVKFASLGGKSLGEGITLLPVERAKLAELLGPAARPRVYVLDPAGKVVWFDLEYSLSTHRELHATLDELVSK